MKADDSDQSYDEREAVAVFDDERSLHAAVDALMQIGFRQDDMSLLADAKALPGSAGSPTQTAASLEDKDNVPHAAYVSPEARNEGLAALVGLPMYVVGAGAAAMVATGGAALIPTIAVVAGGGLAASALGLMMARAFGRRHAERVQQQLANGGLLLWVHMPDDPPPTHTVKRTWGVADIPLHDVNPDPLLR